MLTYNLNKLFAQRAIKNKIAFLTKNGFDKQTAARIIRNKFSALKLTQIEKLCLALHCTPNDIIQYTPDPRRPIPNHQSPTTNPQPPIPNHPLTKLIHPGIPEQLANIIDDIPIDKLNDFTQQIKTLKTQLLNNT
ncbi:MAG: helix-turn-helix transcriptional regulator [Ignavibacteriales bacterium]|nr:MAG: helix-turn-helix transcriptional regulator [Ignavibacteriales bacterium]